MASQKEPSAASSPNPKPAPPPTTEEPKSDGGEPIGAKPAEETSPEKISTTTIISPENFAVSDKEPTIQAKTTGTNSANMVSTSVDPRDPTRSQSDNTGGVGSVSSIDDPYVPPGEPVLEPAAQGQIAKVMISSTGKALVSQSIEVPSQVSNPAFPERRELVPREMPSAKDSGAQPVDQNA